MAACTLSMINGWQEKLIEAKGDCVEMEMGMEFKQLTADIISYTTFGTSFMEGKEVFEIQMELMERAIASITDIFIPGIQYLPTRWNRRTWILKRRMRNTLKNIIVSRLKSKVDGVSDTSYGDDLLGLMMGLSTIESSKREESGLELNMDEIMDECKTFFLAGHETTSHLLTWTMFLLSINKEWQEKVREEVLRECGMGIPDADKLSKLKLVNMVLLEALRLYTPVIVLVRKATKEMKLGNLTIPKNTQISIPLAIIHRNKKYWGEDANEFNPMRFAEGVKKAAKHPNALVAFSIGPRACIGQNFAIMEGKTVMALILQRFSFSLSPDYKHAPTDRLTLQPQYGLPILLKPLQV
ncbi:cytochrome P450 709B2-like protein isoform X2 [Cinnamomum micranthum f. kanehirae]|uniref:Cytochrome P450 709B2-like protein isoform X2 n=1 Tax=Cinnamomum micranthum f. kanehirae TaxID=337451 RepID=A0A443NDP9_9MAGN|nr:cytochrome P450 709B2-like protein isoform X2 [Cinnamomum micranthum f. kanehirae]